MNRFVITALFIGVVSGCAGTTPTPSPTASPALTTSPPTRSSAPTATAAPTAVAPGIAAWTMYTSDVYGITFGYPDNWNVEQPATRTWQAGDGLDFGPIADIFTSPDGEVAFSVLRIAAEPGADIASREGLGAFVCELDASVCQPIADVAEPMCLGRVVCLPAVLVPLPEAAEGQMAFFADPETRMVTVVQIGREDSFPGAARYGGSVQLLRSILTTMDVSTPEPGQIPSDS